MVSNRKSHGMIFDDLYERKKVSNTAQSGQKLPCVLPSCGRKKTNQTFFLKNTPEEVYKERSQNKSHQKHQMILFLLAVFSRRQIWSLGKSKRQREKNFRSCALHSIYVSLAICLLCHCTEICFSERWSKQLNVLHCLKDVLSAPCTGLGVSDKFSRCMVVFIAVCSVRFHVDCQSPRAKLILCKDPIIACCL